ncbi:nitrilase-related carbon-nitrogen hydrolase [Pseudomonas sp. RIT-PI-q]|uniref:nitrilase-related carbon-nitrogen hydrolase n=1 Tax=Pseudomonas sp. RIT-PI-q TaxID=1690247 RepID=UPI001F24A9B6|nr:nitrilase-related carbon-nitrogen hydrolase [Pseudomonas sp. RIT-PI-q]
MGITTTFIGLLPDYATIGIVTPILLVALRFLQRMMVGGEWSSASNADIGKIMTKAAVVQASSIAFEPQQSVEKAVRLIREASDASAELAVFPEAFIGGYPKDVAFGTVVGHLDATARAHFQRYVEGAVTLNDPELVRLSEAGLDHARKKGESVDRASV